MTQRATVRSWVTPPGFVCSKRLRWALGQRQVRAWVPRMWLREKFDGLR